jgi:hypothetical protein
MMALYAYRNYNPQPYYPAAWGHRIEGWLYLPAFGVLLSPVVMIYSFATDTQMINGQAWVSHFVNGNPGLFVVALVEQIYNIGILVFAILMIVLFFQRRSSVPRLMIYYYAVPLIWLIVNPIIVAIIAPGLNTNDPTNAIIRSVIASAIWIPYFMTSQRVKRTFVNRYDQGDGEDAVALQTVSS